MTVERFPGRVLRVVENIDLLSAAFQPGFIKPLLQRQDFIFFNRLGRAIQQDQIGVIRFRDPLAVAAFLTGESVVDMLTDQTLR